MSPAELGTQHTNEDEKTWSLLWGSLQLNSLANVFSFCFPIASLPLKSPRPRACAEVPTNKQEPVWGFTDWTVNQAVW